MIRRQFITGGPIALISLMGCMDTVSAQSSNVYNWLAQSNSPKGYPAQFVYANISYGSDSITAVPSVRSQHMPWGSGGGLRIVGPDRKQVPTRLSLAWMSFSENQFYAGDFRLPGADIERLFQIEGPDPRGVTDRGTRFVVVGVAPGGTVSVWVSTKSRQVEVAHFRAQRADFSMSDLVPTADLNRREYVNSTMQRYVERFPDSRQGLNQPNPGYWAGLYRVRYNWRQVIDTPAPGSLSRMRMEFHNGERVHVRRDDAIFTSSERRAVPRSVKIYWSEGTRSVQMNVTFEPFEILRAFQYVFEDPNVTAAEFTISPEVQDGKHLFAVGSGERIAYLASPVVRKFVSAY